jgi:hypothetical protein
MGNQITGVISETQELIKDQYVDNYVKGPIDCVSDTVAVVDTGWGWANDMLKWIIGLLGGKGGKD